MITIKEVKIDGYQKVIEATDPKTKLHCFIAIHSTALGPSLGGTRIYPYTSSEEALADVLKLAKAMTFKSAVAELGIGGGKSVIIADPENQKNEDLLMAFGKIVDTLKGAYIAAEDVGSSTEDMAIIHRSTPYVAALPKNSSGDPSRFTAWGVFRGIQAAANKIWGSASLKGKKILVQGLGNVGSKLVDYLFWEGAELLICESNKEKLKEHAIQYGAKIVDLNHFASTECDLFAPCAMGGVINENTVHQLKCRGIAGGANNQLASPLMAEILKQRSILYAPDYVINAGGLINATEEFNAQGYNAVSSREKVNHIYSSLLTIFEQAEIKNKTTPQIADEIAENNLLHQIGQRKTPINFQR